MKLLVLASAVSLAVAAAFGAAAHPPHKDSCIWTRDLRNHTIADNHTLYALRFTGMRDKLARIRNQTDLIARSFKLK